MKMVFEKNVLRKYILMVAVLLLFFAGGYRAYTLYKTYHSYEQEIASIEKSTHTNIHNVLKIVINEAHEIIDYTNTTIRSEILNDISSLHSTLNLIFIA